MQFPTIHLNGSHGPSLQASYTMAMHAVHDAMVALQKIDLNPRDYYVQRQTPGERTTYTQASIEHQARWRALAMVHADLEAIIENIQGQIEAKERA